MYAEIQAGVTAVKGALDLLKAGKEVIDQAAMASALSEIQQRLMDTQTAALSLLEENSKLSKQVRELEAAAQDKTDWKEEASKYSLTKIADGVSVYTVAGRADGELLRDAVKLCPNCFEARKRSVLQLQSGQMRRRLLICLGCKSQLEFNAFADWQLEQAQR